MLYDIVDSHLRKDVTVEVLQPVEILHDITASRASGILVHDLLRMLWLLSTFGTYGKC